MRRFTTRPERGATMVESAIVFPLVIFMIMGLLEGALIFRTYLSASNGTGSGARIGSIQGADPMSDYSTLQAIKRGVPGASIDQINSIIIYKANGPGDGPTQDCITQAKAQAGVGITGVCNVYNYSDLSSASTNFGPHGNGRDLYWAPTTRGLSLSAGTDYLGIWIEMTCQCFATSTFGISPQLHSTSVIRLEAQKA